MVVSWAYNAGTNTATASGAGSTNFAALVAADTAGGWGKFTADATGTQIICNAKIIVGDGTNACTFSDSNKQIIILAGTISSGGQIFFYTKTGSTTTLGVLADSSTKRTSNGCTFIDLDASGSNWGYIFRSQSSTALCYLYGCSISAVNVQKVIETQRAYNCILTGSCFPISELVSSDYYHFIFSSDYQYNDGFKFVNPAGTVTINSLFIQNRVPALHAAWGNNALTITNLWIRGSTKIADMESQNGDLNLVNADSSTWSITFRGGGTGKVYRQYEFDLTTDTSATVVLTDNASNEIFNVTSNAGTGAIATQTVSRGYYATATGDTLQDYGPHTLTITKAGKDTHTETLTLTEKTKLQITLETPTPTADVPQLPVMTGRTRTIIREIPDPVTEPALMAMAVLLIRNRQLKRKVKRLQTNG